jgi:hypothetical protein
MFSLHPHDLHKSNPTRAAVLAGGAGGQPPLRAVAGRRWRMNPIEKVIRRVDASQQRHHRRPLPSG